MGQLLVWARRDRSIHQAALPIFRRFIQPPDDLLTSVNAVCGIEIIEGDSIAHPLWMTLLNHPNLQIARSAALTITRSGYTSDLLRVFSERHDAQLRKCILRTLGRLKDPVALPTMIEALKDAELRPDAIEGLGDLNDYRAIPYLEPFLHDKTQTGYVDNHGPPLLVCDIAGAAISRLKLHSGIKPVLPIPPAES